MLIVELKEILQDLIGKFFKHILCKTLMVIFPIFGQSLTKRNCHNSRTSDYTDMKFVSVIKIDKRNKTVSKKLTMTPFREILTSLPVFKLTSNLEQFGIPNV